MIEHGDNPTKQPVLVVPKQLTQSAYATLVAHGCVARSWHLEGRYGSRTFAVGGGARMGLPLLPSATRRLQAFLDENTNENNPLEQDLRNLLSTDLVEIVYLTVPVPRFVEKLEKVADATTHPERMPPGLPIKQPSNVTSTNEPVFTFVDLFCGIGGFAVALEAMGGQCILASDINETCREMYLQNVNLLAEFFHGDIYQVPDSALPRDFDLLVGGFPCQPFSSLGEQPGFNDSLRALLYAEIVRVLKVSQPRAFLLENVPGLLDMGQAFETIVVALEQAGYHVTTQVCSARGLTAQSRKRLFFVGLRKDGDAAAVADFQFPFIPDLGLRAGDILEYDSETDENDDKESLDKHEFYRITNAQMEQLLNRSKRWKPAKLAWHNNVCDTLDGHYGVTIGKGNSQLVPCRAPLHPRCFTARECARLMGFPSSYQIPFQPKEGQGARAHLKKQYLMFGNAVCPPLIAVLAGAVLSHCSSADWYNCQDDWNLWGLDVGIHLALNSTLLSRQAALCSRLQEAGLLE